MHPSDFVTGHVKDVRVTLLNKVTCMYEEGCINFLRGAADKEMMGTEIFLKCAYIFSMYIRIFFKYLFQSYTTWKGVCGKLTR